MSYTICHILYVIYYMSYTIYHILYVIYYTSYTICHILYVIYYISCIIYHILYVIYYISYTIYHILYVIYYMSYIIYFILVQYHNLARRIQGIPIFLPLTFYISIFTLLKYSDLFQHPSSNFVATSRTCPITSHIYYNIQLPSHLTDRSSPGLYLLFTPLPAAVCSPHLHPLPAPLPSQGHDSAASHLPGWGNDSSVIDK